MSGSTVEVPAWEWYGWGKEELRFPEGWNVHVQRMRGHGAKPLSPEEISERLARPKGSPQLRDLASGTKRCAIIIDDMTRPTKTYQILPSVLDELHGGGLEDDQISFVMASGAHSGRTLIDFRKKLGEEVPSRFMVYNHNPYENLADLGETSRGTPVRVNREVAECDLKVSVGAGGRDGVHLGQTRDQGGDGAWQDSR